MGEDLSRGSLIIYAVVRFFAFCVLVPGTLILLIVAISGGHALLLTAQDVKDSFKWMGPWTLVAGAIVQAVLSSSRSRAGSQSARALQVWDKVDCIGWGLVAAGAAMVAVEITVPNA
jgi:hypothetical protein